MTRRLFVSFSGGETSALMTHLLTTKWADRYDERAILFANTGQENEETLEFVRRCDEHWGWGVVWVEAVVHHGERKASTHRVVDFLSASRKGEPFESYIQKFGIPNQKFKDCTRELKRRPLESYIKRELGWVTGTYDTAIGIRADELSRRSAVAEQRRLVYPLLDWEPTTKPGVNTFWRDQPFRLRLAGYQGNCKWCWKKSFRKLMTVMDDDASIFDFPERMERLYGLVGPEFLKDPATREHPLPLGYHRTFFRGNLGVPQLREMYKSFDPRRRAEDDAVVFDDDDPVADGGCSESCEVDWAEGGEE